MRILIKIASIWIIWVSMSACIQNNQSKHGSDNMILYVILQNQQSQTGAQTNRQISDPKLQNSENGLK